MRPPSEFAAPSSLDEAESHQSALASRLDLRPLFKDWRALRTIGAVVVDPAVRRGRLRAAVVVFRADTGAVLEQGLGKVAATGLLPELPALASFRFMPVIDAAMREVKGRPDGLMVEGDGVAHRRGFGLACHLGVRWDLPSFGVSARCDFGEWDVPPPGLEGSHVFIKSGGAPLGLVVRTRVFEDPVFLSPGHRMDMMSALEILLASLQGGREPKPFLVARKLLQGRSPKSYNGHRGHRKK